ncbi:cell wall hydrolase [Novosphingobium kunmingense]|uniref:Cell wall hydrolase n=1 Tax=Novosphingobium kunmingense TaxID=1211806 RepID=A0A2N0I3G6_9SPHN|nr:cell wall hydrolase [Novosphingobium kunmingense]PKB25713.1 cell wall hydrolase [Novosphingobium kunmingense]
MSDAGERKGRPQRGAAVAAFGGAVALAVWLSPGRQSEPKVSNRPTGPDASMPAMPPPDLLAATADNTTIVVEAAEARAANAALPIMPGALEPAPAFVGPDDPATRLRAETCLAQAIYYEAGFESERGRRAVAQVVLNRVRHPAYARGVCDVVYQRIGPTCQFTFACDGALARVPVPAVWDRALREAREALAGRVEKSVGMATHYHADYVYPAWAPRLEKVAAIGQHLFYRWPQGWGRRAAFTARYAGVEPGVVPLPAATETGSAEDALASASGTSAEIQPRRSDNDAGYVDVSKGWRPSIADLESEAAAEAPSAPQLKSP